MLVTKNWDMNPMLHIKSLPRPLKFASTTEQRMMTEEERERNESKILCNLNYRKLMAAPLEKLERYDLVSHYRALERTLFAMRRCDDFYAPGLRSVIAWGITNEAYESTKELLGRRALLRLEKALEENVTARRSSETAKALRRARSAWRGYSDKIREELLEARRAELGEPSAVEKCEDHFRRAMAREFARLERQSRRRLRKTQRESKE